MPHFKNPFPSITFITLLALLTACLLSGVDQSLFLKLNHLSQALPDAFWEFLTTLSDPIVAPLLVFSLFYQNTAFLRAFFIALIIGVICNYSLKHGFDVARPSEVLALDTFNTIGPAIKKHSFPSGHTLTIYILLGLISAWYKKRWLSYLAFITASIISFARISVGAHWPSDLLFGALLGWMIGWLAVELHARLPNEITTRWQLAAYFIALFAGIFSLITKTPYAAGQWFSTAVSLFAIAYALRSITTLLNRQKG